MILADAILAYAYEHGQVSMHEVLHLVPGTDLEKRKDKAHFALWELRREGWLRLVKPGKRGREGHSAVYEVIW